MGSETNDTGIAGTSPTRSRPSWTSTSEGPGPIHRPGPDRYAWVGSATGRLPANRLFFAEPRDLVRAVTPVRSVTRRRPDGTVEVTVTAATFARFVVVDVDDPLARCDDNYFDLEAGTSRTVTVTGLPADVDVDTVRVRNR